jgi:hypothetical protein
VPPRSSLLVEKRIYLAFPPFWKPLVHFVALGFILRLSLATLHLFEQNHSTAPSFVCTKADPVPGSMSLLQKLQRWVPTNLLAPPHLTCFTLSFAENENITHSDRPLHVSCKDSSLVPAFHNLDSNLSDFSGHSCSTQQLNDFGGDCWGRYFFIVFFAH